MLQRPLRNQFSANQLMELSAQLALKTTARLGLEGDFWDPQSDTLG